MKKILYLFLTVSLIFSSCKKEDDPVALISGCMDETASNYNSAATTQPANACNYAVTGCTDPEATNYNQLATVNSGCIYNISGAVWGITSLTINGDNEMDGNVALYLWANGDYGSETWSLDFETLLEYEGGPGIGTYSTTPNSITLDDGVDIMTFSIDPLTDNNNMTWRATGSDGEALVATLVRSDWSLSQWK